MTALGVYQGYDLQAVARFEQWLGRPVDNLLAFVGHQDWADFTGGARWAAEDIYSGIDRSVIWSVPLIVEGANLGDAAQGDYNGYYRQAAEALAATRPGDGEIWVRTGWEFNATWFPWAAEGQEAEFAAAYRQFVETFRDVSDRFRFEWNVNAGNGGGAQINPADAYPGDAYVDVIAMDFYWGPQWGDPADPDAAWNWMVNRPYGLQWLEDFADSRGKPTAYAEWGVNSKDGAAFIAKADAWFDSHDVLYQNYWDSDVAFPGRISDNSDPATGDAYRRYFADASSPEQPPPPPPPPAEEPPPPAPTPGVNTGGTRAAEVVAGTDGNDTLRGQGGNDSIYGGDGDDRIRGGGGTDWILGGEGEDTFVYRRGDQVDSIGDFERGTDTLEIRGFARSDVTIAPHAYDGMEGSIVTFAGGGHVWLPGASGLGWSDIVLIA